MKNHNKAFIVIAITICLCAIMAVVDGIFKANYALKSIVKLILFSVFPIIYALFDKELKLQNLFTVKKRSIGFSFLLGTLVYIIITGGYFLLKDVFDFSGITVSLTTNIGVNRNNFVYVSLYISFINSLLEEFFFRGFVFSSLKKTTTKYIAYLFSAIVFSLYHVAMMIGWFSTDIFLIILFGLFFGGLIFNFLNEKSDSIYTSWFVHMFANFAINTIGFMLFGII